MSNPTPPPVATTFPSTTRFVSCGLLGWGSMGHVYKVHDRETDAQIALKTLPALTPEQIYRLKREFRVLAGITHPNLVELYELFVDYMVCFFTMEYVAGVTFTEFSKRAAAEPSPRQCVARTLGAASQLVAAVVRLHDSGKVHRDIKPSNVLVEPTGRVVLLDFGLSRAFADHAPTVIARSMAGTPAYFAPEQAWGTAPSPSLDAYGIGVMLFEALTGTLPFSGSAAEILRAKERRAPPSVRTLVPDVPTEIADLVAALMDRDPVQRPGFATIFATIEAARRAIEPSQVAASATRITPTPTSGAFFIGRQAELRTLHECWNRVGVDDPVMVEVAGTSGIGKSELVRQFLSTLTQQDDTVVFRGRCHPQESVPYKALDAIIDDLSRFLVSQPPTETAAIVPRHSRALLRIFPVLGRVAAFANDGSEDEPPEAFELRRRGFGALRELLTTIARHRRLAIWIDDLQWADADSASLLIELLRPPQAPPLMMLLSFRSEERARIASLFTETGTEAGSRASREIALGPLPVDDAWTLASRLCADFDNDASIERLDAIVEEAEGSPFFIFELARTAGDSATAEPPRQPEVRLRDVVTERVRLLSPRARALLEVIAVAGWPTVRSVALAAAALGEADRPLLSSLEHASLVRATTVDEQPAFEVYHDRIRESVIAALSADERRRHHHAIATTLQRLPNVDPQALYEHYLGAEERDPARRYAIAAADGASRALAFSRAATLYRKAIDLGTDGPERISVLERLGDSLQGAGRGLAAAEAFEQAAAEHLRLAGDQARALTLRQRASEQFVRSGAIERGLAMLHGVLDELGIALPRTQGRAVAAAVVERMRFLCRGSTLSKAAVSPNGPQRSLLEAYWSAAASLTMVDPILADAISVRGLRKALDLGDRSYAIRGLGLEAAREAALGGRFFGPRSIRLLATLEGMARYTGDPYDLGWVHQSVGGSAYLAGQWRVASEQCSAAASLWRARCVGAAWEIVTAESFALSALAYMGELAALARRLPAALADGDQRDDVYAGSGFRMGILNMHWLAQDRPEEARRINDEAVARWPRDRFLLQHFLHLVGALQCDLYLGDGAQAWARILDAWPALRRAHLMSLGTARIELLHLRARAAVSAATACSRTQQIRIRDRGWTRGMLLRAAARDAGRLERERLPPAPMFAAAIRAGVMAVHGRRPETVRSLHETVTASETAGMALYRASALIHLGNVTEGETTFLLQGVKRPAAMAAMLLPGIVPAA